MSHDSSKTHVQEPPSSQKGSTTRPTRPVIPGRRPPRNRNEWDDAVAAIDGLTPSNRLVLSLLGRYVTWSTGLIDRFPGQHVFGRVVHKHQKNVAKHLRELREAGHLVTYIPSKGRGYAVVYLPLLTVPEGEQLSTSEGEHIAGDHDRGGHETPSTEGEQLSTRRGAVGTPPSTTRRVESVPARPREARPRSLDAEVAEFLAAWPSDLGRKGRAAARARAAYVAARDRGASHADVMADLSKRPPAPPTYSASTGRCEGGDWPDAWLARLPHVAGTPQWSSPKAPTSSSKRSSHATTSTAPGWRPQPPKHVVERDPTLRPAAAGELLAAFRAHARKDAA